MNAAGNSRFALYTFRSLTKRLKGVGNSWLIVVKTLMVFHRCIRDGGKIARQGLLQHLHENTGAFDCSNFKDDSNKDAWERGYVHNKMSKYIQLIIRYVIYIYDTRMIIISHSVMPFIVPIYLTLL